MRFQLRSLFFAILAVAVFFALGRVAGYLVAAGSMAAFATLAVAVFHRADRFTWRQRLPLGLFALTALWFLAVDRSWFVEGCSDCLFQRFVREYRVFAMPVSTTVYAQPSDIDTALTDLGVPCPHKESYRWHETRFWGLLVCRCPCFTGTIGLTPNGVYNEAISARMRKRSQEDPAFAADLHDRVIKHHDYAYFWKTLDSFAQDP